MEPVGLGNTRILTDFTQKYPWTLYVAQESLHYKLYLVEN